MEDHRLSHPFGPLFQPDSRVLILGSFPSVKSREMQFFYGHPQNRFWRVMAALLDADVPQSIPEKKRLLLSHGIALWDVIASCEIAGSADASIRHAQANDLRVILAHCAVRRICCNGQTAFKLYQRLIFPSLHREAICLPSTSPANAAWSLQRLIEAWRPALALDHSEGAL